MHPAKSLNLILMQFLSEREHFDQTGSLEIDQTLCSVLGHNI